MDARYTLLTVFESGKNELINEFRNEISVIRVSMMRRLERDLIDIEFQIMKEVKNNPDVIPEYLLSKKKDLNFMLNDIRGE